MVRTKARENAFLLLFQASFPNAVPEEVIEANTENGEIETDEFCEKLFNGVISHTSELDEVIEKHLVNWKKERISKVALTVLRLALFEMYYCDDISDAIAISQGINLLKKYGDEKSKSFVNGILGNCSREKK